MEIPPMEAIGKAPMEVEDSITLAQKDGAMAEEENNTAAEQAT